MVVTNFGQNFIPRKIGKIEIQYRYCLIFFLSSHILTKSLHRDKRVSFLGN